MNSTDGSAVSEQAWLDDPDVQRMLRVRDGDEGAFSELVAAYQGRLVGIFGHMLGSAEQAEDLAQDVFLRIYRARNGYQPTARFSTWLFRIATNLACNVRRKSSGRREVQLAGSPSGELGTRPQEQLAKEKSALMPSRLLATDELRQVVREALDELNERQRMALLLHRFEGMSYADVGAAMELSPSAVKSLLSRARESLRTRLEAYVRQ